MKPNSNEIKKLITKIGFIPRDGENGIYCKCYVPHDNYMIFVDLNRERILYDSDRPSRFGKSPQVIFHRQKTLSCWSA